MSEAPAASEANLDLWVLRTLGLKDRDTIDTSGDSSSSAEFISCSSSSSEYNSSFYDAAVTSSNCPSVFSPSSSSEFILNSSFSPSASTLASPSINDTDGYCQTSTPQTNYSYRAPECQEANTDLSRNSGESAVNNSVQNCADSPDGHFNFTTTSTAAMPFIHSTASSPTQTQEGNPAEHLTYCSLQLRNRSGQSQDTIRFSPPGERVQFCPVAASSPVLTHAWMSERLHTPTKHCHSPASPLVGFAATTQLPAMPQTPRGRTDLAFSMSLSPSSSVKTHSFPQGQAFVRKDTEGRWNFTWVPKQRH
ncbi:hypothetical protein LDENG_00011200 [Lucifuga dentata]|nr:hypothetical protein LDENG_00011200 [Lucifuga dentata]